MAESGVNIRRGEDHHFSSSSNLKGGEHQSLSKLPIDAGSSLSELSIGARESLEEEMSPEKIAQLEAQIARNQDTIATIYGLDISLLSKAVIPSSPELPVLPPSKESTLSSNVSQDILSNPWLQPSFLAGFTAIMNLLAGSISENKKLQADFTATANSQILQMAVDTAFLTKGLYSQRSADLYTQAASAAAGAVISGVQLGFEIRNINQAANSESVKRIEDEINNKKKQKIVKENEIDTSINNKKNEIHQLKNPVTASSSSSHQPANQPNQSQIDKLENEIADLENDKITSNDSFEKKIKELEIDKDRTMGQERSIGEAKIRTLSEIFSSIKESVFAAIRGGIQAKEGEIQSKKDIQEGARSVTQAFQQSVTSNRDSAKQELSQLFDFISRIIESEFRSHAIRQQG